MKQEQDCLPLHPCLVGLNAYLWDALPVAGDTAHAERISIDESLAKLHQKVDQLSEPVKVEGKELIRFLKKFER